MNEFITCLDCETTGLDYKNDFIIQLSMFRFKKDEPTNKDYHISKNWYIKPVHKYVINQNALETHGLTEEFIEQNGVSLKDIIPEVLQILDNSDILTYNGNAFDIKFLYKDFMIFGKQFPLENKQFYDAYALECRFTPRDLGTVYKKYTGKDLTNAHDAMSDVMATVEVFNSQLTANNLTLDDISEYNECNLLSPEASIRRNNQGNGDNDNIVFSFGKYKDSEFMKVANEDPRYIKWFMDNVASDYTKRILREYYKKHR